MKILVTIPHYFNPRANSVHGSEDGSKSAERLASLHLLLENLVANFQSQAFELHFADRSIVHRPPACTGLEIVFVVGDTHLLDAIDRSTHRFHVARSKIHPRLLGFECHRIMRDNMGSYDLFFYCEDDLVIRDPLFFAKIDWFSSTFGADFVLQPNRFERPGSNVLPKFYVDGDLPAEQIGSFVTFADADATKSSTILGRQIDFVRARNPHAGCFGLTRQQLERWTTSPRFLDQDCSFVGPLESAATLGLIRNFKVYKPAEANRWFLEIEHCGTGYADRFIHPALPKRSSTAS